MMENWVYYIVYQQARIEHAWLLRQEKMTLTEVGNHLGVGRERARQMIMKYARQLRRSQLHVRGAWD